MGLRGWSDIEIEVVRLKVACCSFSESRYKRRLKNLPLTCDSPPFRRAMDWSCNNILWRPSLTGMTIEVIWSSTMSPILNATGSIAENLLFCQPTNTLFALWNPPGQFVSVCRAGESVVQYFVVSAVEEISIWQCTEEVTRIHSTREWHSCAWWVLVPGRKVSVACVDAVMMHELWCHEFF